MNTANVTIRRDVYTLLKATLMPLAMIAKAYDENNLDDKARKWYEPHGMGRVYAQHDPKEVELYTGRGGRRLLVLADVLNAREALKQDLETTAIKDGIPVVKVKDGGAWRTYDRIEWRHDGVLEVVLAPDKLPTVTINAARERARAKTLRDVLKRVCAIYDDGDIVVPEEIVEDAAKAVAAWDAGTVEMPQGRLAEVGRDDVIKIAAPVFLPKLKDEYAVCGIENNNGATTISLMPIDRLQATASAEVIAALRSWPILRDSKVIDAAAIGKVREMIEDLGKQHDANVDRLKACEMIAEGVEDWHKVENECPSTVAVAALRRQLESLRSPLVEVIDGHRYDAMCSSAAMARGLLEGILSSANVQISGRTGTMKRFTDDQIAFMREIFDKLTDAFKKPEPPAASAERRVVTEHVNPPIPLRTFDWSAAREGYDPESNQPVGWGATEEAAIAALKELEDERNAEAYNESDPSAGNAAYHAAHDAAVADSKMPAHAPWCATVATRRMLPRPQCNCPASPHKHDCATKCRQQAVHKHDCDCGRGASS